MPPGLNPMSGRADDGARHRSLYYLAAMLWLSLDMHHWMLVGFQKTYTYLPIGGAHLSQALRDGHGRAHQPDISSSPCNWPRRCMAVSFIVSLIFSVLGRAVPQMNVFARKFRRSHRWSG